LKAALLNQPQPSKSQPLHHKRLLLLLLRLHQRLLPHLRPLLLPQCLPLKLLPLLLWCRPLPRPLRLPHLPLLLRLLD
jgi:hypothetical protein